MNGMAVSKIRAFGGTFLVFSDYMRPAVRLASIMELPTVYVYTHDSIGVGEDGPTHQPVEHLAALRAIPGLIILRPADATEVVEAWKFAMQQKHEPVALVLTRQAVPTLDRQKYGAADGLQRGAYVLSDAPNGEPDVLLMASGSEITLALDASDQLKTEGIQARVVSIPSFEIFEHYCHAHPEYRETVLPASVQARVSVEMATTFGWDRYIGLTGAAIGMHSFGASAPLKDLLKRFGITTEAVVNAARQQVSLARGGK
jgi:transketolase